MSKREKMICVFSLHCKRGFFEENQAKKLKLEDELMNTYQYLKANR